MIHGISSQPTRFLTSNPNPNILRVTTCRTRVGISVLAEVRENIMDSFVSESQRTVSSQY